MDTVTADINEPQVLGARTRVAAFVELTKPRIAILLVLTSAAGFYRGSVGTIAYLLFTNSMISIDLLAF